MKQLLTANEAVARGFYEYGGAVASAYPGTPSTEILENIAKYKDELYCEWAPNEKVAMETAIGAAIAGGRSIAVMKHVGLNVAADPLFTVSYTGTGAGFIIVSADDPELHSSQNEQDNRHYARSAKIAMLEPSDSQEAKDFVKYAFEMSERFDVPVLMRMTTRICHSKSTVNIGQRTQPLIMPYKKDRSKYDTIPAISRKLHTKVELRQSALAEYSSECKLNYEIDNGAEIGIVAAGVSFQYAREVFGTDANYFKVGMSYPMPIQAIRRFADKVKTLYVIEELDPFMEDQLKAAGINCIGKEKLPIEGELNPTIIRKCLLGTAPRIPSTDVKLVNRAPALCAGCPHRGLYIELGKYKDAIVSSDIGCYSLGGSEPYNAKDTSICMGASISVAHGMKKAFEHYGVNKRVCAVIGDSTFFHTGVNSLMGLIYNKGTALTIILDNRITGMTGHQQNPGTGYTLTGEETSEVSIERLVKAMGVENVKVINPLDLKEVKAALEWGFDPQNTPAVIITRYPCALKKYSTQDKEEFGSLSKCHVDHNKCVGCRLCLQSGCPALAYDGGARKVSIIDNQCTGCTVCVQMCPKKAIGK